MTFENGSFTNIGYHTITPEGVNGLTIASNTFVHDKNFMDLEVDNDGLGNGAGTPTGDGQWNITIENNTFSDGAALWVSSIQGQCIPQKNIVIEGNVLDATSGGLDVVLGGSESSSCGQDTGLTIEDNVSHGAARSPCGGSIASPPVCSMIEVDDYRDVTISGNYLTANDGDPQHNYYDNTIFVPCMTFNGVSTALVQDNTCNNAWDVWDATQAQFPSSNYPNTAIAIAVIPTGSRRPRRESQPIRRATHSAHEARGHAPALGSLTIEPVGGPRRRAGEHRSEAHAASSRALVGIEYVEPMTGVRSTSTAQHRR